MKKKKTFKGVVRCVCGYDEFGDAEWLRRKFYRFRWSDRKAGDQKSQCNGTTVTEL